MTGRERLIYHQIHPLKLGTDWCSACVSFYLLWRHRPVAALLVQFVPAILVSTVLLRWADLEPQRRSGFGRYVERSMTPWTQALRLAGNGVMSVGAWYCRPDLMMVGLLTIAFGWLYAAPGALARFRGVSSG